MSSGDVNDDGIDDIIIGAPGESSATPGVTYVVFGSVSPLEVINLATLGSAGMTINGFNDGSSGMSVNSGDVNGDGKADIIIGAPWTGNNLDKFPGAAYVVFGSESPQHVIQLNTLGS